MSLTNPLVTEHFVKRARERIGLEVDGWKLGEALMKAVAEDRTDFVRFVSRINRTGRRLFIFRVPDGRLFHAIIDTQRMVALTVLADGEVGRQGRAPVKLRAA